MEKQGRGRDYGAQSYATIIRPGNMSRGGEGEGSLKNEPELYAMETLNGPNFFLSWILLSSPSIG